MVKAVDGGGGRGIRLIRNEEELASSVKRAIEESPSKLVFAEKAAIDGFRHVEVQIIGDGSGDVTHLWERECSIQRRYQKVVEFAPSAVKDRDLIARLIENAMDMARHVSLVRNLIRICSDCLGQLLLAWDLRVLGEPRHKGILLLGSQPTNTSRAHNHRIHHHVRLSQSPVTTCPRRNVRELWSAKHCSLAKVSPTSIFDSTSDHRRKRGTRLVSLHREDYGISIPDR